MVSFGPVPFPGANADLALFPTGFTVFSCHCLSFNTRAAPAAAAVETRTAGQAPNFFAGGCDSTNAPKKMVDNRAEVPGPDERRHRFPAAIPQAPRTTPASGRCCVIRPVR